MGICDDDKVFCAGLEEIICELAKELYRQIETEVWYSGESLMHIVYVSSREEYAMQLFKLQPLDFLIKPVSKEQVYEVLERSMRQREQGRALFEYQKGGST